MPTVTVTQQDIDRLRATTSASPEMFADPALAEILALTADANGNVYFENASMVVWERKAGQYADLVDVTEGNSSRKMSDLHKNALKMVDYYRDLVENATYAGRRGSVVIADIAPRSY